MKFFTTLLFILLPWIGFTQSKQPESYVGQLSSPSQSYVTNTFKVSSTSVSSSLLFKYLMMNYPYKSSVYKTTKNPLCKKFLNVLNDPVNFPRRTTSDNTDYPIKFPAWALKEFELPKWDIVSETEVKNYKGPNKITLERLANRYARNGVLAPVYQTQVNLDNYGRPEIIWKIITQNRYSGSGKLAPPSESCIDVFKMSTPGDPVDLDIDTAEDMRYFVGNCDFLKYKNKWYLFGDSYLNKSETFFNTRTQKREWLPPGKLSTCDFVMQRM